MTLFLLTLQFFTDVAPYKFWGGYYQDNWSELTAQTHLCAIWQWSCCQHHYWRPLCLACHMHFMRCLSDSSQECHYQFIVSFELSGFQEPVFRHQSNSLTDSTLFSYSPILTNSPLFSFLQSDSHYMRLYIPIILLGELLPSSVSQ